MAFTTDGQPRTEEKLAVQAFGPEAAEIIEVTADPGTPGRYTGRIVPPKTGDYRLRFQPEGAPPVEALLKALPGGEELRHPNINRPALALLAS